VAAVAAALLAASQPGVLRVAAGEPAQQSRTWHSRLLP
jgi:hypothetical protein